MLSRLRIRRPSHATVVAYLALFVALGGTSFAAVTLKRNSVRGKHIAKGAITSPKVKDRSLVASDFALGQLPQGPKGDRGEPGTDASLSGVPAGGDLDGTYPNPTVRRSETMQYLTADQIGNGFTIYGAGWAPPSFYKDREGRVHLRGLLATPSSGSGGTYLFTLPAGYRPCDTAGAHGGELLFVTHSGSQAARLDVGAAGGVTAHNWVTSSHLSLNGISFATNNC